MSNRTLMNADAPIPANGPQAPQPEPPRLKDNAVYIKTYFRINAGYVWGRGMPDDRYAAFEKEIREILGSLGFDRFERSMSCSSLTVHRGSEHLYCHPMDLSGPVKQGSIHEIGAVLKTARTFSLRAIDTYEEFRNYTKEELLAALEDEKAQIGALILENLATQRRTLAKFFDPSRIRAIPCFDSDENQRIVASFLWLVLDGLVKQGRVVRYSDERGDLYRTVPPKSRRKAPSPIPVQELPLLQA